MGRVTISDSILTDVADAIREKTETEDKISPVDFAELIQGIEGEGNNPLLDYIEIEAKLNVEGSILQSETIDDKTNYYIDLTDIGTDIVAVGCNHKSYFNISSGTTNMSIFLHKNNDCSFNELGIDDFFVYPNSRTFSLLCGTYIWAQPYAMGNASNDVFEITDNKYYLPSKVGVPHSNVTHVFRFYFR